MNIEEFSKSIKKYYLTDDLRKAVKEAEENMDRQRKKHPEFFEKMEQMQIAQVMNEVEGFFKKEDDKE